MCIGICGFDLVAQLRQISHEALEDAAGEAFELSGEWLTLQLVLLINGSATITPDFFHFYPISWTTIHMRSAGAATILPRFPPQRNVFFIPFAPLPVPPLYPNVILL